MKTDSIKVQNLFILPRRHLIPLFQRPYVWNRADQWEPLWEDISRVATRELAGVEGHPHFLGAVVLDQIRTGSSEIEARLVIDGQQRLTTLQLLLGAFRDVCDELGDGDTQRRLLRLTENEDAEDSDDEQRFKVWPTNVDRQQFAAVMATGDKTPDEKIRDAKQSARGDTNIVDAYNFFLTVIREWLSEGAANSQRERTKALSDALKSQLYLVAIDLGEEDEAQVIFETLNARGTPLLPIDLVKNHLFQKASQDGTDVDRLYNHYWRQFDEQGQFWRKKVGRGHAQRPRVDLFILHYLTMITESEVSVSHIFDTYKRFTQDRQDLDITAQMALLAENADIFKRLEEETTSTDQGRFLYRLRAMDVTTVYPLLLYLQSWSGRSDARLARIYRDLESFLVRRLVCRLSTRGYNRLFLDLLSQARQAEHPADAIREYLLSQTAEANRWPTDEEFQKGWETLQPYKELLRARLRMILEALEAQLRSDKSEDIELKGRLTIEHIIPQAWEEYWPLPTDKDPNASRVKREGVIHKFGNLTLLTKKLNPAVSNGGWERKRQAIREHSALALNRWFHDVHRWDEESVDLRTTEMYETAVKVWPRP